MSRPVARVGDATAGAGASGVVQGPGSGAVLVGGLPVARVGDLASCVQPSGPIVGGESSVHLGGGPAAAMGDAVAGGAIVGGSNTVLVGNASVPPQASLLVLAAQHGVPFVEVCKRKGRRRPRRRRRRRSTS